LLPLLSGKGKRGKNLPKEGTRPRTKGLRRYRKKKVGVMVKAQSSAPVGEKNDTNMGFPRERSYTFEVGMLVEAKKSNSKLADGKGRYW